MIPLRMNVMLIEWKRFVKRGELKKKPPGLIGGFSKIGS